MTTSQFVEDCRTLISIDSSPSQGNRAVVSWVAKAAQQAGLTVVLQEERSGEVPQANVIIRPAGGSSDEDSLMLQTHLDTADPGPFGLWKENHYNPFDAHIIDGKIFGVGTANCKLDFLCKLEALKRINARGATWAAAKKPVLVGTFGAEDGMTGALKLMRKNLINPRFAIIGEPSSLRVLVAGKGQARIQIRIPFEKDELAFRTEHNLRESTSSMSKTFSGKPAHASTPQLGDSAIKKLFYHLAQLPEDIAIMEIDGGVDVATVPAHAFLEIDPVSGFRFSMAKKLNRLFKTVLNLELEFASFQDQDFTPSHPTLNIGSVRTFEDSVELAVDVRIVPQVPMEIYEKWMDEIGGVCRQMSGECHVNHFKRPYRADPNSTLVQGAQDVLAKLGRASSPKTHSSTNEASLFSRAGVECISFGPGQSEGNVFTPREHVTIDDLKAAVDFYVGMIEKFCC
ncbi:MAG: succinyl-diaminopimelate desuccinylase [Bdellovibrio sp.]|nr:MAG: succinyl-diaminopimelate desuccinylase [Bdellovibrio sp.]